MVIMMFTKLSRRMDEHSETFNNKNQVTNENHRGEDMVTEMKNTLDGLKKITYTTISRTMNQEAELGNRTHPDRIVEEFLKY